MKVKILFTALIASLLVSCNNNEIEEPSSKSAVMSSCNRDSLNLGDITYLEKNDQLLLLKQIYNKLHPSKLRYSTRARTDNYDCSNMYAIRELPVTIKVRSVASSSDASNVYLNCSGAGREVFLSNSPSSEYSKFFIKIFPLSSGPSGIPYSSLYSNVSKTPLRVGAYTRRPNEKILVAGKDDSRNIFFDGWNFTLSPVNKGFLRISNNSYFGQSDPNDKWSVFPYVLEASCGNTIRFNKPDSNKAQQEFQIVPDAQFELKSIEYDLNSASVSNGGYETKVLTATNPSIEIKVIDFPFNFSALETSSFSQDKGELSFNLSNGSRSFARPSVVSNTAMLPDNNSKEDATYEMPSTQNIYRLISYTMPINAEPRSIYKMSVKFKFYYLSIDYTAKAYYTLDGDTREINLTGKWFGKVYEDPSIVHPEYTYDRKSIDENGDIPLSRPKHLKDLRPIRSIN